MILAQINLTRGQLIPGLGSVMKLENVECEGTSIALGPDPLGPRMPVNGLVIVTSVAKVVVPWDRIESVVTVWLKLNTVADVAARARALAATATPLPDAEVAGLAVDAVKSVIAPSLDGRTVSGHGFLPGGASSVCCAKGRDAWVDAHGKEWTCPEHGPAELPRPEDAPASPGLGSAVVHVAPAADELARRPIVQKSREELLATFQQPPPPAKKGGRR